MIHPYTDVTFYHSLDEEHKKIYNSNYSLAQKIISRLQMYQISKEIMEQNPAEIIENLLVDEQLEVLKEINKR